MLITFNEAALPQDSGNDQIVAEQSAESLATHEQATQTIEDSAEAAAVVARGVQGPDGNIAGSEVQSKIATLTPLKPPCKRVDKLLARLEVYQKAHHTADEKLQKEDRQKLRVRQEKISKVKLEIRHKELLEKEAINRKENTAKEVFHKRKKQLRNEIDGKIRKRDRVIAKLHEIRHKAELKTKASQKEVNTKEEDAKSEKHFKIECHAAELKVKQDKEFVDEKSHKEAHTKEGLQKESHGKEITHKEHRHKEVHYKEHRHKERRHKRETSAKHVAAKELTDKEESKSKEATNKEQTSKETRTKEDEKARKAEKATKVDEVRCKEANRKEQHAKEVPHKEVKSKEEMAKSTRKKHETYIQQQKLLREAWHKQKQAKQDRSERLQKAAVHVKHKTHELRHKAEEAMVAHLEKLEDERVTKAREAKSKGNTVVTTLNPQQVPPIFPHSACPPGQHLQMHKVATRHSLNTCGRWYLQHSLSSVVNDYIEKSGHTIQFHPNRIILSSKGRRVLRKIATVLRGSPSFSVSVLGETPVTGQAGRMLADGRAATAKQFLQAHGVHNHIHAAGKTMTPKIDIVLTIIHEASRPAGCTKDTRFSHQFQTKRSCVVNRSESTAKASETYHKEIQKAQSGERESKIIPEVQLPPPTAACQDAMSSNKCAAYKPLGFCKLDIYRGDYLVKSLCRKTCGGCQTRIRTAVDLAETAIADSTLSHGLSATASSELNSVASALSSKSGEP